MTKINTQDIDEALMDQLMDEFFDLAEKYNPSAKQLAVATLSTTKVMVNAMNGLDREGLIFLVRRFLKELQGEVQ